MLSDICSTEVFVCWQSKWEGDGCRLHAVVGRMAGNSMDKNVQDKICIKNRIKYKSAAGMQHTPP